MHSGQRRILIQRAVDEAVKVTCGFPLGCGLAVDLLHVDLVAEYFGDNYGSVLKVMQANRQVNPTKTVVISNGTRTKQKCWKVWRAGHLLFVRITTAQDPGMSDLRASARRALGKGASLCRSATLEVMAYGDPTAHPQVSADLSMVPVWHRRVLAGQPMWPLEKRFWTDALK
eukprot:5947062-Amphidinium_carterae.3